MNPVLTVGKKKRVYRSVFSPDFESSENSSSCSSYESAHVSPEKQSPVKMNTSNGIVEKHGNCANSSCSLENLSTQSQTEGSTHESMHTAVGSSPKTSPQTRLPYLKASPAFQNVLKEVKRNVSALPSSLFDLKNDGDDEKESDTTLSSANSSHEEINNPDKESMALVDGDDANRLSGEDSSEEDKWEIVESEGELDNDLDLKSSKFSLSAINVKSIIHKIITNENVVEMVRKAVQEEMDGASMVYEPKLTRAKLKEFEAQGQVPTNWGLSPSKKPRRSPNFLEMELPEDEEDDEDFNPERAGAESDEDSESLVSSSYLSELGSPAPSTPLTTPSTPTINSSIASQDLTPSVHDSDSQQSLLSPMGPPLLSNVPKSHHKHSVLGQKYRDSLQRESEEIIASRTRSKYPLKDQSIFDLEANFVAPDISEDLYDTSCDDHEWREFLTDFIKLQPDTTLTCTLLASCGEDDEEEDPEYNFLEEKEDYDLEDFRDDKAVKVSKKEVTLLLDELYSSLGDNDPLNNEEYKRNIKVQSDKILVESTIESHQSLILEIGDNERLQINDQMRKHVQLLAQMYVMTQNSIEEHQPIGKEAKTYLFELSDFAGRSEALYRGQTAFRACNLDSAIAVINRFESIPLPQLDQQRIDSAVFTYDNQSLPRLHLRQMYVMWADPTFLYPDLLPPGGLFRRAELKRDRQRVKFLDSEDNLLAMGLAQFSTLKEDRDFYIQKFMLPSKSVKQIQIRIKNLRANAAKDNPVKFFKKYKMLPTFPQYVPVFSPDMIKAPKDSGFPINEMPDWCKIFCPDVDTELGVRDILLKKQEMKKKRRSKLAADLSQPDISLEPILCASNTSSPWMKSSGSCSSRSSTPSSVELNIQKPKKRRQCRKQKTQTSINMITGGLNVTPVCVINCGQIPLSVQGMAPSVQLNLSQASSLVKCPLQSVSIICSSKNAHEHGLVLPAFQGQIQHSQQTPLLSPLTNGITTTRPMTPNLTSTMFSNPQLRPQASNLLPLQGTNLLTPSNSFRLPSPLMVHTPSSGQILKSSPSSEIVSSTVQSPSRPTIIVIHHDNPVVLRQCVLTQHENPVIFRPNVATQRSLAPKNNGINSGGCSTPSQLATLTNSCTSSSSLTMVSSVRAISSMKCAVPINSLTVSKTPLTPSYVSSTVFNDSPNPTCITPGSTVFTGPCSNPDSSDHDCDKEPIQATFEDLCKSIAEDEMAAEDEIASQNEPEIDLLASPMKLSAISRSLTGKGCKSLEEMAQICEKQSKLEVLNEYLEKKNTAGNINNKDDSKRDLNFEQIRNTTVKVLEESAWKALKSLPISNTQTQVSIIVNMVTRTHAVNDNQSTPSIRSEEMNIVVSGNSQRATDEIQSEIITSTTPEQSLDKTDQAQGSSVARCVCTPPPELTGTDAPSDSLNSESETGKRPKTALEMVASFASLFFPYTSTVGTVTKQQRILEKTPTKSGDSLIRLAPNPDTSPGIQFDPAIFKRSPASTPRRKPRKVKSPRSTPRKIAPKPNLLQSPPPFPGKQSVVKSPPSLPRKLAPKPLHNGTELVKPIIKKTPKSPKASAFRSQLNRNARAILPKNFVITSFVTSPAKKAASCLVDRAKNQHNRVDTNGSAVRKNLSADSFDRKNEMVVTIDNSYMYELGLDDEEVKMDTESDEYTQSEDEGDTQGTEGEDAVDTQGSDEDEAQCTEDEEMFYSQDESQEEEGTDRGPPAVSHTHRFEPTQDSELAKGRLGRKDRDRDLTLALLAPDIVESDPQRDMRDTLFVQNYLQRVKKALQDDMDTLERFLKLMAGFIKSDTSPVQLYMKLQEVFGGYPDLLRDFACFLQPDQASKCGCYRECMEFHHARLFLRKLEIYFSKNPNQYQRVVRILARWNKKVGHTETELKDQIEPLIKGNKHLMEEFSRFYVNERPSESLMEDFEDITLQESEGDSPRVSSCEEISLVDVEDTFGTKRCSCDCHSSGDDIYRQRKKHCYQCCLTVIDGELVYKVNKSTIKKVNVTYGPTIKASSLLTNQSPEDRPEINPIQSEQNGEPDLNCCVGNETTTREPTDQERSDWDKVRDQPGHHDVERKESSGSTILENVVLTKETIEPMETFTDHVTNSTGNQANATVAKAPPETSANGSDKEMTFDNKETKERCDEQRDTHRNENVSVAKVTPERSFNVPERVLNDTSLANDILAAAFNKALSGEMSMDSMSFSNLISPDEQTERILLESEASEKQPVFSLSNFLVNKVEDDGKKKPVAEAVSGLIGGSTWNVPTGDREIKISNTSSFSKITQSSFAHSDVEPPTVQRKRSESNSPKEQVISLISSQKILNPDLNNSQPFSPFGQEVETITGSSSVMSPGFSSQIPAAVKGVRRITPIPVKGSLMSETSSSFQAALDNSPVLPDMVTSPLSLTYSDKSNSDTAIPFSLSSKSGSQQNLNSGTHLSMSSALKSLTSFESDSGFKACDTSKSDTKQVQETNDVPSGMVFSQPAIHSEDANVGFPGLAVTTQHSSVLMSDESLFQCFAKCSDTLHSVSNLTNMLNVLDGHSNDLPAILSNNLTDVSVSKSVSKSANNSEETVQHSDHKRDSPSNVQAHNISENKSEEVNEANKNQERMEENSTSDSQGDSSFSSDHENTPSDLNSQYYPHSVQSIENMERLTRGQFWVSSLSDSDSSTRTTPSSSMTDLSKKLDGNSAIKDTCNLQSKIQNTITCEGKDSVDNVSKTKKVTEKRQKMSRRELRKSLHSGSKENTTIPAEEQNSGTVCNNETGVVCADDKEQAVRAVEYKSEQYRNDKSAFAEHVAEAGTSEHAMNESSDYLPDVIKIEPDIEEADKGTDDMSKSRGKKKSKHKSKHKSGKEKKQKRKRKDFDDEDKGSSKRKKIASDKAVDTSSDADDMIKGNIKEKQSGSSLQTASPSLAEPVWSKETDKTILEMCKMHGIKDKTFQKIAQTLGKVTEMQVRERFAHLYKLIFGIPYKETEDESI